MYKEVIGCTVCQTIKALACLLILPLACQGWTGHYINYIVKGGEGELFGQLLNSFIADRFLLITFCLISLARNVS